MQESGWRQKAEQESFLPVFPEAMPPDTGIPSRFGSNAQIWNDGSKRFHAGRQDIPDVAFVKAMLDDLATRFRVDRQRVYATGFSNGASMAFRVGVELSGRLAAIAPVAGALWLKPQRLNQPVSLYYITGDADPLNPFAGGVPKFGIVGASREMASRAKPAPRENVMAWVRLLGCPPEPKEILSTPGVTTEVYRGERDSREVRFTVLKGHGHAWPGGKSLLPESLVGKASTQFKATDAIWNFFEKQRLMEQK
jgi:polyhydroxybutyrate depolymerase